MTATALIVDDEVDLCRLMQMTLTKMGIKSSIAYDLSTARQNLSTHPYDFCLTDMRLPDGSGLDLVKYIAQHHESMPVAVITAHGNMDIAIEALKLGAFDFVNKPLELPRLRQLIEHALRVSEVINDASIPKNNSHSTTAPNLTSKTNADMVLDKHLVGNSPAIVSLKATIVKLARSQAPVFLWGESGTGKEVVAKLIHKLSPRREGSFVAVNCGAIPYELMESEFFGHKKGSFTGAVTDKIGLFQQADGGTLFLDELADLPLAMQVKLLRAIQEKSIRAIGDTKEIPVDIRILSATHKDLNKLVQQEAFRQDLFYRINVIELKLPTLNERGNDIDLLADYFVQKISEDWGLDQALTLSSEAYRALRQHHYEGNVRELRNLLERAITLSETNLLTPDHLGLTLADESSDPDPYNSDPDNIMQSKQTLNDDLAKQNNAFNTKAKPTTLDANNALPLAKDRPSTYNHSNMHMPDPAKPIQATTPNTPNDIPSNLNLPKEGLEIYLQNQERQLIVMALNQTNWNKTRAAKLLGTSFRSLRYRMNKLEIDSSDAHDNFGND